jgi:hypothetical protein
MPATVPPRTRRDAATVPPCEVCELAQGLITATAIAVVTVTVATAIAPQPRPRIRSQFDRGRSIAGVRIGRVAIRGTFAGATPCRVGRVAATCRVASCGTRPAGQPDAGRVASVLRRWTRQPDAGRRRGTTRARARGSWGDGSYTGFGPSAHVSDCKDRTVISHSATVPPRIEIVHRFHKCRNSRHLHCGQLRICNISATLHLAKVDSGVTFRIPGPCQRRPEASGPFARIPPPS